MSTGAKVAIGCLVAVVGIGVVVAVVVVAGAYWAKGKVDTMSARASEFADYEKKANANPFTVPADGVIEEARLVKFLEVRKQVYTVYEQHKADFESLKDKKEADLSDVMKVPALLADIKQAQAKAQAQVGMSDGEYLYLFQAIYKSATASNFEKGTGKQMSEYAQEALKQAKEAARQGNEAAKKAGGPGVSQEDLDKMQKEVDDASSGLHQLDVPKANIELFRKYEADIKKYAMSGLGMIGL